MFPAPLAGIARASPAPVPLSRTGSSRVLENIEKLLAELTAKGTEISHPVSDQGWGLLASIRLPSGSDLALYEPRHPVAYDLDR